ncbi:hypothetical protein B0H13DRAFT_1856294 [Mycena leptocephala]|nr:hypothetical protein B0H13DRAFT_1856294 [Mycena leptocephala]
MSDKPARDANGNLRDAADMEFYESESDTRPLPAPSAPQPRRGDRKRATDKLTESLAAEKADDDGNAFVARPKRSRAKAPRVKAVPESVSDQEDSDFELPDLVDPSDSEGSDDEMDVDNTELASILPSKTIPARSKVANSKTQTRAAAAPSAKRKQTSESASAPATKKLNRRATVEEVEDDEAPPIRTSSPVNAAGNRNDRATVEAEDDSPARPVVLYPRTPLAITALQATNTINVTTGIAKSSRFRGLRVPTSVNSSAI